MKRFVALLLVLVLTCSMMSVFAENEEGSKFEQISMKKGSLLLKEFIRLCYFGDDNNIRSNDIYFYKTNSLEFQCVTLTDINSGEKECALRIRTGYYESQNDYGEIFGIIDLDEIDEAVSTLKYIKDNITKQKSYSEIVYTAASGIQIGAYFRSIVDTKLFVRFNSFVVKYYGIDKIDTLILTLELAKSKLEE